MRLEKGRVRAPKIGRVWLNSTPLSFRQLRGGVILVDFWDYTCANCIRRVTFTGYVDPVASALHATTTSNL